MITQPDWQLLVKDIVILARPSGLWTRALDYVAGPRKLKIVADPQKQWKLAADAPCGPDGDLAGLTDPAMAEVLFPAALRGALIGKIGGSAADRTTQVGMAPVLAHPTTVPTPFSVGSFAVIDLDATKRGPLFLTINDAPATFNRHEGQINVSIFWAL